MSITEERLPWFQCYPSKLLGALAGMQPDEGYVYWIVCLRIYETGKPCRDTLDALARRTGLNRRRVAVALDLSLQAGRLAQFEDGIMNPFAAQVLADASAFREERSSAGKKGGLRSAEKRKQKQSNHPSKATPEPVAKPSHLHLHKQEQREVSKEEDSSLALTGGEDMVPKDDFPKDAFEQFWKLYPPGRKGGKKAAASKFDGIRRRREVTFVDLMAGLQRYVDAQPDPQYTKAPEVWLNKGCWDDEHLIKGGRSNASNWNGDGKIGFSGIAARLRQRIAEKDQLPLAQSSEDHEPSDRR